MNFFSVFAIASVATASVCDLPMDVGPCRAAMPVFYFNGATQQCEQFFYGGCQGNDNRFLTKEECESTC
ncbi:unnamed protein product [Oikopleura dioica]|uniref:BPTI/Kunitz inhibitor domain-containing protein n=1 Tax=Oikopleura dioica TaxID=34765 RepID=E4X5Y2_OIKDI|nr:unnamed protein product [Oikopleura dioica]CBY33661.1 unnamed protein product [Oikopleura dioica]